MIRDIEGEDDADGFKRYQYYRKGGEDEQPPLVWAELSNVPQNVVVLHDIVQALFPSTIPQSCWGTDCHEYIPTAC